MNLFWAALLVFAVAIFGMSIGVIVSNRRLRGTCGGLAGLRDEQDRLQCDACSSPSEECAGIGDHAARSEGEGE